MPSRKHSCINRDIILQTEVRISVNPSGQMDGWTLANLSKPLLSELTTSAVATSSAHGTYADSQGEERIVNLSIYLFNAHVKHVPTSAKRRNVIGCWSGISTPTFFVQSNHVNIDDKLPHGFLSHRDHFAFHVTVALVSRLHLYSVCCPSRVSHAALNGSRVTGCPHSLTTDCQCQRSSQTRLGDIASLGFS